MMGSVLMILGSREWEKELDVWEWGSSCSLGEEVEGVLRDVWDLKRVKDKKISDEEKRKGEEQPGLWASSTLSDLTSAAHARKVSDLYIKTLIWYPQTGFETKKSEPWRPLGDKSTNLTPWSGLTPLILRSDACLSISSPLHLEASTCCVKHQGLLLLSSNGRYEQNERTNPNTDYISQPSSNHSSRNSHQRFLHLQPHLPSFTLFKIISKMKRLHLRLAEVVGSLIVAALVAAVLVLGFIFGLPSRYKFHVPTTTTHDGSSLTGKYLSNYDQEVWYGEFTSRSERGKAHSWAFVEALIDPPFLPLFSISIVGRHTICSAACRKPQIRWTRTDTRYYHLERRTGC